MTRAGENPPAAPRRFYSSASVAADAGTYSLLLDGKPARTRARKLLTTASRGLVEAIAEEWNGQGNEIDFLAMPLTRFRMTVIDRQQTDIDEWRRTTLGFLASDLLCYRASSPRELVKRQAAAWDPLLGWAAGEGISLATGEGVAFIAQPQHALSAGAALLQSASPDEVIAIKSAAEIAGSAVIALALWRCAFGGDALFDASRVDEAFQAEKWGADSEAEARSRRLRADFHDAGRYLSLSSSG